MTSELQNTVTQLKQRQKYLEQIKQEAKELQQKVKTLSNEEKEKKGAKTLPFDIKELVTIYAHLQNQMAFLQCQFVQDKDNILEMPRTGNDYDYRPLKKEEISNPDNLEKLLYENVTTVRGKIWGMCTSAIDSIGAFAQDIDTLIVQLCGNKQILSSLINEIGKNEDRKIIHAKRTLDNSHWTTKACGCTSKNGFCSGLSCYHHKFGIPCFKGCNCGDSCKNPFTKQTEDDDLIKRLKKLEVPYSSLSGAISSSSSSSSSSSKGGDDDDDDADYKVKVPEKKKKASVPQKEKQKEKKQKKEKKKEVVVLDNDTNKVTENLFKD
eukprot:TRINITY_DN1041_c0_g3_i1.p1 TRINITY_DN1041_c0_g3~~TRINITY_DN1041_c0_g3_i1.p1  ORF type:complete len:323 (-),score=60.92 TRINITY_DN1041_c0_g3_i1:109-1077(-)